MNDFIDCTPLSPEARLHQWRERRKAVALQDDDGVEHDHQRRVQYLRGIRALTLWRHWWRIRPILAANWSNEQ